MGALEAMIPSLAQAGYSVPEAKVFAELAKYGKKNPIASLVALASAMS